VTDLFKSFVKGFSTSFIFFVGICLWDGNYNNVTVVVSASAFFGSLWALIRLEATSYDSGKDLTSLAKKSNKSTSFPQPIKDAVVSNPVISSDSNKNSSITNSVNCWECRGKGYLRGTSMHGSVITRACFNCSRTGKVTHADFVKYKNKGREAELKREARLGHKVELQRKAAIKLKEEAQRKVTIARVNNNINIYKVGVNFLGNSRRNRTTWCHGCKQDLSSSSHLECSLCGWLRCHCGTCKQSCGWRTKAMQEWM
jgi:hypothetical protein